MKAYISLRLFFTALVFFIGIQPAFSAILYVNYTLNITSNTSADNIYLGHYGTGTINQSNYIVSSEISPIAK